MVTHFSKNSRPTWPCLSTMLVFHWPWFISTNIHSLHPRIFYASDYMPTHCLFSGCLYIYFSTDRCIYQLHPPGSSSVKVMYYTSFLFPSKIPLGFVINSNSDAVWMVMTLHFMFSFLNLLIITIRASSIFIFRFSSLEISRYLFRFSLDFPCYVWFTKIALDKEFFLSYWLTLNVVSSFVSQSTRYFFFNYKYKMALSCSI